MAARPFQRGVRPATASRQAGFTVIEAAATVVAISLLTFCLVPALGGVAKGGKKGRCLSNLGRLGYANTVYASLDPNNMALPVHANQFRQCPGQLPGEVCNDPIYVGPYDWGGKSGVGRAGFWGGNPQNPHDSRYGSKLGFGPATRPLNRIIYPNPFANAWDGGSFDRIQGERDTELELDVYRCPSDTGYTGMHCPDFRDSDLSSYDYYGTSYNANIFMVAALGGYLGPDFEVSEMGSNSPYLHSLRDLRAPARTLAFQENCGRFAWMASPEQDDCQWIGQGVPGTPRGWHGKDWTFNVAFIDGHADTIYMRGYRNEVDDSDFPSYGVCIRVRGEGWQVDVLPVPPVRSFIRNNSYTRPSYEDCFDPD